MHKKIQRNQPGRIRTAPKRQPLWTVLDEELLTDFISAHGKKWAVLAKSGLFVGRTVSAILNYTGVDPKYDISSSSHADGWGWVRMGGMGEA